jgi:hypothetical protein
MATFTEKQLACQAVNAAETLYTVPASTKTIIKDINCMNNSATAATISIWLVPNGGSASDENCLIKNFNVPAADLLHWSGFQVLATAGDTIRATAGTADKITVIISGAELT